MPDSWKDWIFPTETTVLSGWDFLDPRHPTGHYGIDIAPKQFRVDGDPVVAPYYGRVIKTAFDDIGYGYHVVILTDDGYRVILAHLSEILIGDNSRVNPGTLIGKMGTTGSSTGTHLHYEVIARFNKPVNPWDIFGFNPSPGHITEIIDVPVQTEKPIITTPIGDIKMDIDYPSIGASIVGLIIIFIALYGLVQTEAIKTIGLSTS